MMHIKHNKSTNIQLHSVFPWGPSLQGLSFRGMICQGPSFQEGLFAEGKVFRSRFAEG